MLKRWESQMDLAAEGAKKFDLVKDADGRILDYQNVRIRGYLSTFRNVTESDRDGDYVEEGAFTETLLRFRKNPILLIDHSRSAADVAGHFDSIKEDNRGLAIEATLLNAQTEQMRQIRSAVAEGALRTLSMGGLFHYKEDGRGIFKVDLWEGSLVAVPANPDAMFSTRELSEVEVKRWVQAENRSPGETIEVTLGKGSG